MQIPTGPCENEESEKNGFRTKFDHRFFRLAGF
jgi:hypothetical protein